MNKIIFFIALISFNYAFAGEEKEIETTVKEVTVFFEGAQITRVKEVEFVKGETILVFGGLSPFIDGSSVQVKALGDFTVLSVNHRQNYLAKSLKSEELVYLNNRLKSVEDSIRANETKMTIIEKKKGFLEMNRDIGGRNQELNIENLREAYSFYGEELTDLLYKEKKLVSIIDDLKKQQILVNNQISTLSSKDDFPTGEIAVKIRADNDGVGIFELNYMVNNAGWFPSYDIRAKSISEPLEVIYYANVMQDTKEDWDEVKLRFSSSEPNVSGVAPELQTYFLDYHLRPPTYSNRVGRVSGRIIDANGQPISFAIVRVEGTSIGAYADIDGQFVLTVPPSASNLVISSLGYETLSAPITGQNMNFVLNEVTFALEQIAIVGYEPDFVYIDGMRVGGRGSNIRRSGGRVDRATPLQTIQLENQVSVEFEIDIPFTIKSDNKNYSVEMAAMYLPADFQYFSIPKIDNSAFLIANISNWDQYNLLEGEANVFFEDTYVGKTILDVRFLTDTLKLSLGRDKAILINREKTKDLTTRRFIGTRKEEVRNWKTTVRNNKGETINMVILDQVPVSTNSEIEVTIQELSKGMHNPENGEIKWDFTLESSRSKEFELQYSVRFPRNRVLNIQ